MTRRRATDAGQVLSGHGQRIDRLERRRSNDDELFTYTAPIFDLPGDIALAESARWITPVDCRLVRMVATLASGTGVIFDVKVNGVVIETVTVDSGTDQRVFFTGVTLAARSDYVTLEVTDAGTSAVSLTVLPEVAPPR